MSHPRTVTIETLDHGQITIPEPDWCTGHDGPPQYRVDITHDGPDIPFNMTTSRGQVTSMIAALSQHPFSELPHPGRTVHMWVEIAGGGHPSNPQQLRQIAAALTSHAFHLRTLANQLTELLAAGDR
ncbi:hypothetical protein KQY30_24860 [Streptomyces sp. GMY02]|uniref:DUF6907 domain-containing protein n=1 Tax=Streptomyces sp. GMY02 TaxID=1333528 RepID=UPI001C2C4452|nr:hypothetical protein [Streptomyces sp. GMY02]QXE36958.1 hypothetical protein KQY30_24860 [Streptomyces sp. GMY02]